MKKLSKITLTLAVLFRAAHNYAMAHDDVRLVEAIAQVESGGDDSAIGSLTGRGERALGRYQILPSTWADRTDLPVELAHRHLTAQSIAVKHIQWLKERLEKRSDIGEVTNYHLILAWRFGHSHVGRYDTREQFLAKNGYANRVLTIYSQEQASKYQSQID